MKRNIAEFIGTFWLVLGGCGSAVLAAAFPEVGIGLAGVALAFWFNSFNYCLFFGAYLRGTSQSGCDIWPLGWW